MTGFRSHGDTDRRRPVRELLSLTRGEHASLRVVELDDGSVRLELWVAGVDDRPAVYVVVRRTEVADVSAAFAEQAGRNHASPQRPRRS